ncbi:MAG TPA: carboxymuconolactone decarboxylase family protein [Longimicrobiaceae bacterium]|nr:carboxymuconolactone decarboxylase family protein [Longimicrobiaceae bacterium]
MPRVTPLSGRRAPLLARFANRVARWRDGKEYLPIQVMAHNPRFIVPYVQMGAFAQGKIRLDPVVRRLAMQLAGEINGCGWCSDYGAYLGRKARIAPEKLGAVMEYRTSPLFTPAERAALAFADEMTQVGGRVSDETFAEARRWFGEREIVELAAAVAAENFFNRMNGALGVEEQGFCALPAAQPA